jgi:hypothetical protein
MEAHIMTPLERLLRLEAEYHRLVRTQAQGSGDATSAHTSFALQAGYEALLRQVGTVTPREVETLRERLTLQSDPRDLLAARDSVRRLLELPLLDR